MSEQVVAEVMSEAEAELIAGYLRAQGVPSQVLRLDHGEVGFGVARARVIVPGDRFDQAVALLRDTDHVNATDPGSAMDVGVPDDDVRDYLEWRAEEGDDDSGEDADDADGDDDAPGSTSYGSTSYGVTTTHGSAVGVSEPRAGRVPLVPLLVAAAAVVVMAIWLAH